MNKLFPLFIVLMMIPCVSAKTMDNDKRITVNSTYGSVLIDAGSFSGITKDSENITILGYNSNVIGSIGITTNTSDIIILNATSNGFGYMQNGSGTHYIYLPSKNQPIVHGGSLISYSSHLSEINTIGATDILFTWLVSGTGLSLSFILIILIITGGISLYMALKANKRRW